MADYEETVKKAREAWKVWADVSMTFMVQSTVTCCNSDKINKHLT
jgi:hypothetical protein